MEENGAVEIARCFRGQYFGELALVTNKPRAASAHAIGTVKCLGGSQWRVWCVCTPGTQAIWDILLDSQVLKSSQNRTKVWTYFNYWNKNSQLTSFIFNLSRKCHVLCPTKEKSKTTLFVKFIIKLCWEVGMSVKTAVILLPGWGSGRLEHNRWLLFSYQAAWQKCHFQLVYTEILCLRSHSNSENIVQKIVT